MKYSTIFFLLLLTGIFVTSCRHPGLKRPFPPAKEPLEEKKAEKYTPPEKDFSELNIVLVLGGLDARGYANIGILRGLEKHHIFPSRIIATGMGALTAALYCAEKNSFALEWKHFKLSREIYFDFSLFSGKTGKINPQTMLSFIRENVGSERFRDLALPLTIITTDFRTGEPFVIEKGNLARAIYSALAIPGLFAPLPSRNKMLFTGYLLTGLPIKNALDSKADVVIAVDLEHQISREPLKNATDIQIRTVKITGRKATEKYFSHERVFILKPDLKSIIPMKFDDHRLIMNIGLHTVDKSALRLKQFLTNALRQR